MNERTRPVVVVTGSSAGARQAVARAEGQRGAKVALLARGGEGLDGAAHEVRRTGDQACRSTSR